MATVLLESLTLKKPPRVAAAGGVRVHCVPLTELLKLTSLPAAPARLRVLVTVCVVPAVKVRVRAAVTATLLRI